MEPYLPIVMPFSLLVWLDPAALRERLVLRLEATLRSEGPCAP